VTRTPKPFHLGWFKSFGPADWMGPWAGDGDPDFLSGASHLELARALERACFDFLMLEDSSMVSDVFGGSAQASLAMGAYAPKGDPLPLASLLTGQTRDLGVVATLSSTFYPPWLLARAVATLDHLSGGRAGWNCVTSSENLAARNYGMAELPPHDERYDRADEFVRLVKELWTSWEPDALTMDAERGVYVDHSKVHPVHFEGKYHRSRGPLNLMRPPQGTPVICQAGGSPRGRRFAAAHADIIIALPKGLEEMRAYRAEIRRHALDAGRDPDEIKVMYIVAPLLADTDAQARRLRDETPVDPRIRAQMINWSGTMEIDFSQFDLDAPLPEDAQTNGHQSTLATFRRFAGDRTLREALSAYRTEAIDLTGSPDTVAQRMGEAIEFVGGDGFLIMGLFNRRYLAAITDGLVPALQRRGLTRTTYTGGTLRENLRAF